MWINKKIVIETLINNNNNNNNNNKSTYISMSKLLATCATFSNCRIFRFISYIARESFISVTQDNRACSVSSTCVFFPLHVLDDVVELLMVLVDEILIFEQF
jgi:hypothetical protein